MTYTREQILNMPAGRELDMLINIHVFGYIPVSEINWWLHPSSFNCDPSKAVEWLCEYKDGVEFQGKEYSRPIHTVYYGSKISAAWEVVERTISTGNWMLYRISQTDAYVDAKFECTFVEVHRGVSGYARGVTAPEAICKAALLAVMGL